MKEKLPFKPLARLIPQLGDQLIKNESIALLELVKNAYDADATDVKIWMKKIDDPKNGLIIIEDNGTGMDLNIIRNVWMKPGSDYKKNLYDRNVRSPIYARLPLGEKGIGRFGAHKLGQIIKLISKKKGFKEVCIEIDWSTFQQNKYLEEIPVEISERPPQFFKRKQTGTRIEIGKLNSDWNRGKLREVARSLNSLCSPFDMPGSFRIDLKVDRDWLDKIISWNEIEEYALYRIDCTIEGDRIAKFNYEFTPWNTMTKLKRRVVTESEPEIAKVVRLLDGEGKYLDLSNHNIGPIQFRSLIFSRESRILSMGVADKTGFKKYLTANGGVRVYRDGIRVYDYGEPENDWLGMDIRRVTMPGVRISRNIMLGAVNLLREKSDDLREKTNREGFVENEAYRAFADAIKYVINQVEALRSIDKARLMKFYGPSKASEPVLSDVGELRGLVSKKVKNEPIKKEINKYLDRIEQEYKNINETLLMSAGAGLNLSIVIHEIEKIISELKAIIEHPLCQHS